MEQTVDFVVCWVDGSDPAWQAEKQKYDPNKNPGDARTIRYRDWDNLHYWFRSVETFTPWVNKVHFVTWGHVPEWLNLDCPKLNVVRHEDYIPQEYLPLFSSRPIELNIHRIKTLSEQFVYFNDDMFILKPMKKEDFFLNGLPRDVGVLAPYISDVRHSIASVISNNMEIINTTFSRKRTINEKPLNWFNPQYRLLNRYTLASLVFGKWFTGFWGSHFPNTYLKSSFTEVWTKEFDALHLTCTHRFRDPRDVNHWLIRYWQLASNRFIPRGLHGRKYVPLKNDMRPAVDAIVSGKNLMVCLNDREGIDNFDAAKNALIGAFEKILPNKSMFEK